ncbi:hypothetical protein BC835DRAFT_1342776 [Cytidiella melzeri]|nr:hypothetical protein BC835DRAFT_1342776 [Cytidiella melzeri]
MAKARKQTSTRRKKAQSEDGPFGSASDTLPSHLRTPTEEEWRKMKKAKMFSLADTQLEFRKGDDVVLHDPDDDEENRWLAKITSIRQRQTPIREVWVLVQWYYSAKDLRDVPLQNFDLSGLSIYERLMSDREEILNGACFKEVIWVHEYSDDDPDSLAILPDSFFQRYRVNVQTGVVTPWRQTCIHSCQIVYHPTVADMDISRAALDTLYHENAFLSRAPSALEVAADISHFCPKPECRRWFHEACLVKRHTESESADFIGCRGLRLLAVDPDRQEPHRYFQRFINRIPSRGKTFASGSSLAAAVRALKPGEMNLPDSLIEIAARPIVRQANRGDLSSLGNARDVVLARRLLYQELDGGHEFLTELLSQLNETWYNDYSDYTHVWQSLMVHRILATPYAPYWDAAVAREQQLSVRAVVCANCAAAI